MKRAAYPCSLPAKRSKRSESVELTQLDLVPEQCPSDISLHGVDEAKCIAGKFKMTWSLPGKVEAVASVPSEEKDYVFQLFFELDSRYLPVLDFSPLDEFRLSLRGAELRKVSQISKPCTLPIQLVFSNDVNIWWTHQGPGLKNKFLNTWLSDQSHQAAGDSWYHSQEEQPSDSKMRKHGEPQEGIGGAAGAAAEKADTHMLAKQLKRRQRVQAKREKQEAAKRSMEHASLHSGEQLNANSDSLKHSISRTSPLLTNGRKSTSGPADNALKASSQFTSDALNFEAGFRSGSDIYLALKDIRQGQYAKLVGIVTNISLPAETRSGDLMRHLQIVDPSNYQEFSSGRPQGFKINCFSKRHKEWLPHPELGEAVILRGVKVVSYNGALVGTGFHEKLRWAAFSPSKGEYHHGPASKAPRQEGLGASGLGATFSPFLQPCASEIAYCIGLSDWWREITEKDKRDSVAPYQTVPQHQLTHRVHRLISEAGPFVPPDGYFDCTVEVLKLFTNSAAHTMYATDYTRNSDMAGAQSNSWPPSLSEYVLQFEMWDDAARIAEEMQSGQYYSIKNARMRISPGGILEAKVVQDKITKLDESDAATNSHLKALLERKGIWEAKQLGLEPEISYQLIQDVTEGKFFNCTVELLHAVCKPNQRPHVFVTDYTSHPRLAAAAGNKAWSAGHEGHIVKILLSEEQKQIAESPAIGSFYAIRKLRLKYSSVEDCFCGTLGGHEKLVTVLNANKTDNEHLNGLLRRREDWQKNRRQPVKTIPQDLVPAHCEGNRSFMRIKDMPLLNWDVGRYRILAKVVDFYPLQLRDAFYQQCSRCEKVIPSRQQACFKCGDSDHEFVRYLYQMYIKIEDQDGDQIKISINDKCPLLDGLKRAHLQDDKSALNEFCKRVDPLVGSLTVMHDELMSGETVDPNANTPLLCFEVDTWVIVPDAIRAFSLSKYECVPSVG